MYGATREHAPSSTRLAGVLTAATATLAFGYAMANGMGAYIVQHVPDTLIYVPLPNKPLVDHEPPPISELPLAKDTRELTSPITDLPRFFYDPDIITAPTGPSEPRDPGPSIPTPPKPPAMVRIGAGLIPGPAPTYPAIEIRKNNEGTSSLEVCIDARGRVTAANLTSSSGHPGLDEAALKWVRNAKFTPAKLNGEPQSICGHSVSYQWKIERR